MAGRTLDPAEAARAYVHGPPRWGPRGGFTCPRAHPGGIRERGGAPRLGWQLVGCLRACLPCREPDAGRGKRGCSFPLRCVVLRGRSLLYSEAPAGGGLVGRQRHRLLAPLVLPDCHCHCQPAATSGRGTCQGRARRSGIRGRLPGHPGASLPLSCSCPAYGRRIEGTRRFAGRPSRPVHGIRVVLALRAAAGAWTTANG